MTETLGIYNVGERPDRLQPSIHAIAYSDWLKIQKLEVQFDEDQSKKLPSPQLLGLELAEKHRHEWAYHNKQKIWRIYFSLTTLRA